jgi:hypothetical protein
MTRDEVAGPPSLVLRDGRFDMLSRNLLGPAGSTRGRGHRQAEPTPNRCHRSNAQAPLRGDVHHKSSSMGINGANSPEYLGVSVAAPHQVLPADGISESPPPPSGSGAMGRLNLRGRNHPEAPVLLDEKAGEGIAGSDQSVHGGTLGTIGGRPDRGLLPTPGLLDGRSVRLLRAA